MAEGRGGKQLVIAFFEDAAAGEVAARVLAKEASAEEKQGTVGMLALDEEGKVDVAKLGDRISDDGPGIGAVLGRIALALWGGVMPRRGRFFDARSGLSTDDIVRFGADLEAGQAAVAVLHRGSQADRVVVQLTRLGGKTEVHRLTSRALRQAASAPTIAFP